jgi:hypothetical protein
MALISMALRDGEWHPAEPIRRELARHKLNHDATVDAAKKRLRVQAAKQAGVTHGPWGWQIVDSSDSTPNPDSSPPRATLEQLLILDPESSPDASSHKKNQRIRPDGRAARNGSQESRINNSPQSMRAPVDITSTSVVRECCNDPHRTCGLDRTATDGRRVCGVCHPPAHESVVAGGPA